MLVLQSTPGERVILFLPDGRTVTVMLLKCNPYCARIGYEAPQDIRIMREELLEVNNAVYPLSDERSPGMGGGNEHE